MSAPETGAQMTVRELIAALSAAPPDAVVRTEGCDCTGWASELLVAKSGKSVMLRRDGGLNSFDDPDEYLYNEYEGAYWKRLGVPWTDPDD